MSVSLNSKSDTSLDIVQLLKIKYSINFSICLKGFPCCTKSM